jgi:guanylate kinase
MGKSNILVLVGKSASGKTRIMNELTDGNSFKCWVSYTTRPKRQGEVDGYDYYFVPYDAFKRLILVDKRVYHTNVGGNAETWYYGHSEFSILNDGNTYVVIEDPDGLRQLIKRYGRNRIFAVYIDADDEVRKARCVQRKDFDETEWNRRLEDDTKVFADIDKYVNLTVKNNYLALCVDQIRYSYSQWLKERTQEKIVSLVEQYSLMIRQICETTNISEEQAKTLTHIFKDMTDIAQKGH